MIRYLWRSIPVLVQAKRKNQGVFFSRIHRRVRWADCDLNLHMNQSVYFQVCELGRLDWFVRSGTWSAWRAEGINPVVGRQLIEYRKELRHGVRFSIDTRLIGVEGRLAHFQAHVLVGDRVHTRMDSYVLLLGKEGVKSAVQVEEFCEGRTLAPLEVVDWRVVRNNP